MPKVNDAISAQSIVLRHYPNATNFKTQRQGNAWVVKYYIESVTDLDEHEMRIDARDGHISKDV